MAEIVIAPNGTDAIEVGTFFDDDGQRYVGMMFDTGTGDTVIVTMLIPLFQAFAEHVGGVADETRKRDWWRDHPRD